MAKKVIKMVKLQIPAGKANPAPPVGPALGQAGVNIMGFCKEFNARTAIKLVLSSLLKLRYLRTVHSLSLLKLLLPLFFLRK